MGNDSTRIPVAGPVGWMIEIEFTKTMSYDLYVEVMIRCDDRTSINVNQAKKVRYAANICGLRRRSLRMNTDVGSIQHHHLINRDAFIRPAAVGSIGKRIPTAYDRRRRCRDNRPGRWDSSATGGVDGDVGTGETGKKAEEDWWGDAVPVHMVTPKLRCVIRMGGAGKARSRHRSRSVQDRSGVPQLRHSATRLVRGVSARP